MNPDDNPFWGEPTPTDLWDDMDRLNGLYEELGWDHIDYLEIIRGNGRVPSWVLNITKNKGLYASTRQKAGTIELQ